MHVALDVAEGLGFIHGANGKNIAFIHRDIKPANVLLTRTGGAKLCDLGEAREVNEGDDVITMVGTPLYAAPEIFRAEP